MNDNRPMTENQKNIALFEIKIIQLSAVIQQLRDVVTLSVDNKFANTRLLRMTTMETLEAAWELHKAALDIKGE